MGAGRLERAKPPRATKWRDGRPPVESVRHSPTLSAMGPRPELLTEPEVEALAEALAELLRPEVLEEVRRPQPPKRRTMQVERDETQQQEIVEQVPGNLSGRFYLTAAALVAIGALVATMTHVILAGLVLALGFAILTSHITQFREHTERRRTVSITAPVTEEHVVDEPQPDIVDRVVRQRGHTLRRITRVRVPLLVLSTPVDRTVVVTDLALPHPTAHRTVRFTSPEAVALAAADVLSQPTGVPHVLDGTRAKFSASVPTTFGDDVTLVGDEAAFAGSLCNLAAALRDLAFRDHELLLLAPESIPVSALRTCTRPPDLSLPFSAAKEWVTDLYRLFAPGLLAPLHETLRQATLRHLALAGVRYDALPGSIAPICSDLGRMFHYGAFNFYCPSCSETLNRELLARDYSVQHEHSATRPQYDSNTRCVWLADERCWQCRTCSQTTATPLPVHKALDELLLPAYDRLMEENKNERLRIYRGARDGESSARNEAERDVEQVHRQGRSTQDTLDWEVKRVEAVLEGEREALVALRTLIAEYSRDQSAALARATEAQAAIAARVAALTNESRQELDAVFDDERARMIAAMRDCSRSKRIDDEARDAVFADIAARSAEIAQSTARTAFASERTAENTFRTAHATEQTAQNTLRTAVASEQTADNTLRTAVASEQTAGNTQRIATASERTAENTGRVAVASERTATGVGKLVASSSEMKRLQQTGNAIAAAHLKAAGVEQDAPWYNPAAQLRQLSARIESTVLGDDEIARAQRRLGAR